MLSLDEILQHFQGVKKSGREYRALCPAHHDQHPSLCISEGDHAILFKCESRGCAVADIIGEASPPLTWQDVLPDRNGRGDIPQQVVYTATFGDEDGVPLYDSIRFHPKAFAMRTAAGSWSMAGVRRVLYRLADIKGEHTVWYVEGPQKADALWRLGIPTTCHIGGVNGWEKHAADYLAQFRWAGTQHVICLPDNDAAGESLTQQQIGALVAQGLQVRVLRLPGLPPKGDILDFLAAGGTKDQLLALVAASSPDTLATAPTTPRRARWAADIMAEPAPTEILEGVAWGGLITVVASESGAGKTYMLLDAAAAVAAGVPWHGRSTRQGTVAYCGFEGDALGLRLRAVRDYIGHRLDNLCVIRLTDPISPRVTRDGEDSSTGEAEMARELTALQQDIVATERPPLVLVVIDTVRASMTGSEDSSEQVAAYLRAVRRLLALAPQAAGLLAHHAGWQDGETKRKRERGSSSWRGNVDATLYLEVGDADPQAGTTQLTLSALKVRDAERPVPLRLIRRQVTLNEADARGQPVTSCIIERDPRTRADREAAQTAEREQRERDLDLHIVMVLLKHPDAATSQDALRVRLGMKREAVQAALVRVIDRGWVQPPLKQRQPYHVTEAGQAATTDEATSLSQPVGPKSAPVGPEYVLSSRPPAPLLEGGADSLTQSTPDSAPGLTDNNS